MKQLKLLTLGLCFLSLSACKSLETAFQKLNAVEMPQLSSGSDARSEEFILNGNCPQVEIVEELARFNAFQNMENNSPAALVSHADLKAFQTNCTYSAKSVTVDLKLDFEGTLGPRGRTGADVSAILPYPFFVAITAPGGEIIAKQVFTASLSYPPGQDHQTYRESLRQIIPMPDHEKGPKHKILVGFQLSQDQLNYNRALILEEQLKAQAEKEAQENAARQKENAPVSTSARVRSPSLTSYPEDAPIPLAPAEPKKPGLTGVWSQGK